MSGLISLGLSQPDLITYGSTADVVDAAKAKATYESNAPTGMPPLTDIEQWEDALIGLVTTTGQIVTPERARRCVTVLAIMRGLSEDVSALRLPLYRRSELGDVEAPDHPVYSLLNTAPNELMTPMEVREHMMMDLMTWGGFFNLKNDDPTNPGEIASLWPLQAGYVTRRWREPVWTFTDPTTGVAGTFLAGDVWRGTILSTNGLDGTAITLLARDAIGLLLAAEEQGARLFNHGIQTDFVLESPEEVSKEEKEDIRSALMKRHSGARNAFMPMILTGGLTSKKLGLTAQESQYLEARAFQKDDIANVFRYPDVLLGSSGKSSKGSTYASAEQFFSSYTKHTLLPWAIRIEQSGHRDLLDPKEKKKYYLRHDFDQLLRPDQAARFDIWNKGISGGWITPEEARRKEGFPYKPGLDYFTQPAGSTGIAGSPEPAPTDQSALKQRVARYILKREEKALTKESPETFYAHFGGLIEDITGADTAAVRAYLDRRKAEQDRFSSRAVASALSTLTALGGK